MDIAPPVEVVPDVIPADRRMSPTPSAELPEFEEVPSETTKLPTFGDAAALMEIDPLAPLDASPVKNLRAPLTPALPASFVFK
jgi:hypothetical protein